MNLSLAFCRRRPTFVRRRVFLMKTGVFVGLLLGHVSLFGSDPVPSSRLPYAGTWQGSVGVSGGIPARSTIYVALNPGATVSQINAALANCPPDQVVFLNAGTYTLSGGILLGKDRVTLRGAKNAAGVPTTVLNFTSISGGAAIRVEKGSGGWDVSNPGNFTTVNVSSGASRGSTTLALASTPTTLQIGQIMFISAPASSTVTGGGWSSWFGSRPFTQIVKVTAKSGNSVSFTPAINADYLGTGVQAHWREPGDTAYRSGIEDLSL